MHTVPFPPPLDFPSPKSKHPPGKPQRVAHIQHLNDLLPEKDWQFEAVTLLPIYGETLVFYLNKGQKQLLSHERDWSFFNMEQLEGGSS